ncbi:MAG: SPOR domain-containing protein [Acidobacteria bacterium]|nr:SPOR domain-containing protein [Acidobacteriota bacterium]
MKTLPKNLHALFGCWLGASLLCVSLLVHTATAQSRGYTIQIASTTNESEARTLITELKTKGLGAYWVKAEVPGKGTRYRVRIGRYNTPQEAKAAGDQFVARGNLTEFIVMAYDAPASMAERKKPAPEPQAAEPAIKKPTAEPTKDLARKELAAATASAAATTEEHKPAAKPAAEVEVPKEAPRQESQTEPTVTTPNTSSTATEKAPEKPVAVAETPVEAKPQPQETPKSETTASPEPAAEKQVVPTNHAPVLADAANSTTIAAPPAAAPTTPLEPKIATPLIADSLADVSFQNNNWKVVRRSTETDKNLRTIYFVDTMTGWAAGDAGALYRTTDGGRTWKPQLSGGAANINAIQFLDWNIGWMLGEASGKDTFNSDADSDTVFFSTTNGGRTWAKQPLPNVLSVHFTNAQNGWAVGKNATLLHTNNGGTEWTKVEGVEKLVGLPVESSNYNYGFRDVYFLDAEHGWLIGNFYGRARNHIGGLFYTEDGGKNWRRIPLTLQTQFESGRFTPGLLHEVRFTDANHGSVTGEMNDGEGRFFFVLHTRDGGKTWEQFRTPSRATHNTQFLNPENGWMAAFAPREGGAEAVVYDTTLMRTDNGGQSWQSDFVARGRRIRGVFFLSPGKGWAVGDRGMILRYEDKAKAN